MAVALDERQWLRRARVACCRVNVDHLAASALPALQQVCYEAAAVLADDRELKPLLFLEGRHGLLQGSMRKHGQKVFGQRDSESAQRANAASPPQSWGGTAPFERKVDDGWTRNAAAIDLSEGGAYVTLIQTQRESSGYLVQGSSGTQQHVAIVCKRFLWVKLAGDVQGAARRLPEECPQPGVSHNFSANVAEAKFFMRAFH
jgi:hypothetical protein